MAAVPRAHLLFTGPFEALEERFLGYLDDLQKGDPLRPVEILAGSNLLGVYLRRRAAARRGAVANLRFLTFLDLARRVVTESDPRPPLPELGARLLARRALGATPEAAVFGSLRDRPSLGAVLARTAEDLRDARVPRAALRAVLPAAGQTDDRKVFLNAVAAALDAFEGLRERYSDSTSLLERAIGEKPPATIEPLLVYGLYDLGGVREALLAGCAAARPVIAFVPDDDEPPARSQSGPPTRRQLFEDLLGVRAVRVGSPRAAPGTLTVLTQSDNVEAREIVRELVRGVADGIPLHRMAVVLRDPVRQEAALVTELRLRQIPFYRPAGTGASRSPEGRAARALVSLAAHDFPRLDLEQLFALLEGLGVFALHGHGGILAPRLAGTLSRLGFSGGRASLMEKLARAKVRLAAPFRAADDPDGRIGRKRSRERRDLQLLADAFAVVGRAVPAASPASWSEWGERLRESSRLLFGDTDARKTVDAAAAALASLEEVEPSASTASEDILALLPDALDLELVRDGRFERDGVAILSALSARGLLFDLVVVPGLVEQLFPRRGLPDPLLFDTEREAIAKGTRTPLAPRTGARHHREERFLFRLAAASARKRLVLMAARRDAAADRPRVLSPFLLDHLSVSEDDLERDDLCRSLNVRRVPMGEPETAGPAIDGPDALLQALHLQPGLSRGLPPGQDALERALSRKRSRLREGFTPFEGRLGRKAAADSLTARPVSPSRLERLAGCAYRSFFADVLRLEAREGIARGTLQPDPLTRGSLAHSALRSLARELVGKGQRFADLTEAGAASRAKELAAAAARTWAEEEAPDTAPILVGLAAAALEKLLSAVIAFERTRPRPMRVAGAEVRFGPTSVDPSEREEDPALSTDEPAELSAAGNTFRFAGKIDRFDRDGLRGHVVDYKFGRPRPYGKKNDKNLVVAGGERLQLPVYALAARRLGVSEISSDYLFVEANDGSGKVAVTRVALDPGSTASAVTALARFLEIAKEIVDGGLYVPSPFSSFDGDDHCRNCDFRPVCGPGHQALFRRKLAGEGPSSPVRRLERLP